MGNYSIKNITLGIGIGLVISSMINISIGSRELSPEEIKKQAVKHDLIVFTREEILNNQATEAAPTPTPAAAPAKAPAPSPTASASNTPAGNITVEIKSGMSSESIAGLLKDKGAIADIKAFQKRLGELGKDDKLKIGSFEIPKGSSYDDIIKILTR